MKPSCEKIKEYVRQIRLERPVLHCITNPVSICDCANIALAVGASPVMARHPQEVGEIQEGASALVCNFGAVYDYAAMKIAAEAAGKMGHPIVVDPVGIAGSSFRRDACIQFVETCHPDCIRGNYSEILALILNCRTASGVDADPSCGKTEKSSDEMMEMMKEYAEKRNVILAASGAVDLVTDGKTVYRISAGDMMMSRITGSGCMSSVLQAAFLSVSCDVHAAAAACMFFGKSGEAAAEETRRRGEGTMSFHHRLIDLVSLFETGQN